MCSILQLEQEICELAAHLAAGTCRWLLLIEEFDRRRGWAEWGVRSCAHWLSWRCSIGLVAAREHVRVARRLPDLPRVRRFFGSGELSYSKVRAVTRVATPETEDKLVELALHATGAQLDKLIRGYQSALAATLATAQTAHERRCVGWSWEEDGSLRVQARLPADQGALLLAALRSFEEEHGGDDDPGARAADALASLARAALDSSSVHTRGPGGADPWELVVHVDAESLGQDRIVERSELESGPSLAPETVRRLGCDAGVVRIVERDGQPLSVGRRTRTVPPALRRALRSRDDGCRFPGCVHRRFLHAHHIHHWARGGPTTLHNLVQLCSYHHRLVHEGGFAVERAGPRAVRFRRPDGHLIPAAPACAPVSGAALDHQQRTRGLAVNERTCMPRSAGQSLDYGMAVEGLLRRALE
ncbi:MAG TPA: DUF222 domain-containing protein [Solirubrobacteraceae bacterium]